MKNRIIISIMILIFLNACKSFDPAFLQPVGEAFNPKLPAMEKAVENNLVAIVTVTGQPVGASPQDVLTLFDREVSEIMTNPYGDKKGYIILKVNTIETKFSSVYFIISGTFLFVPTLLGLPLYDCKSAVETQIDVMNVNRKLIGSYRGNAKNHMTAGLYGKNNYRELARVSYLLAVKEAIQGAKTKMQPDLSRLVNELNGNF